MFINVFFIGCLFGFGLLIKPIKISATDYYVGPTGTDDTSHGTTNGASAFKTIQYAIGDSRLVAGDTINIAAGTYPENLTINKSINIFGEDQNSTIIQPSSGNAISINNDVSLSLKNIQLKVTGSGRGINPVDSGGALSNVNITLEKVKIDYSQIGRALSFGADTGTTNNHITIKDSIFDCSNINGNSTTANRGISFYGSTNSSLTITNSTITAGHYALVLNSTGLKTNISGSTLVGFAAINVNNTDSTINISNSTLKGKTFWSLTGNDYGALAMQTSAWGTTVTIEKSTITNEFVGSGNSNESLIFSNYGAGNNKVYLDKDTALVNTNLDYAPFSIQLTGTGEHWYIDDVEQENPTYLNLFVNGSTGSDSNDGYYPTTAKKTIPSAITDASSGDTIYVKSGIYSGPVTINKSITINGPNYNRDPNTEDGDNDEDDRLSEATINGLVSVSAADVKIKGFTITNPTGKQGIVMANQSGLVVKNNIIDSVGSGDTNPSGMDSGINISSVTAAINGLTITNNKISNITAKNKKTAHGIIVGFSNGNFDINDLLISENFINGVISDTSDYSAGGRGAYGILLNHAASPATGTTPTAIISKNTITGLEGLWTHGIGMEGNLPNAVISENTINNLIDHKTPTDSVGIYFEVNPGASSTTVENNNFGSEMGLDIKNTMDGLFVNAKNNWWGSKKRADIEKKVSGDVDFIPYYTKESKIYKSVKTDDDDNINTNEKSDVVVIGDEDKDISIKISDDAPDNIDVDFSTLVNSGSVVSPEINLTSEKVHNISIKVPESTTITSADANWDGMIPAPMITTVNLPETSGETKILGMAIEVGTGDTKLSFDKAVRIDFPGEAGKRVGFSRNDVFTEITAVCDGDFGDDLNEDNDGDEDEDDQECKVDVGNDLVVWTKHFTKFATFSSTATSTSTSNGWAAPVCTATKPGSAPTITNTVGGNNNVTLTWSKANDPVTHYLVAYGTKSGSIEYGNPNVGNSNTTSYTIKGLSGGTKYYFKIKAINDCMPGDWSNEVSSTPKGKVIEIATTTGNTTTTPAEGFIPVSQIPSELFDIALIVDKTQINKASDLNARVTFTSFGKEDTPVEMTFTIVDENGKEYYRSTDKTIIQTEGVFNKTFKELILAKGKYTLVLNTLYNTNIKDEFKQEIEINENVKTTSKLGWIIGGMILVLIGLIWLIWVLVKKKNKKIKSS